MSKSGSRRCFFGCKGKYQLFSLPKDEGSRKPWLEFISPGRPPAKLCLCAGHFTADSFRNKGQYDAGLARQLLLKPGAVPSVKAANVSSEPSSPPSLPAAAVALPTKPRRRARVSVATQTVTGTASLGTQFSASSGVSVRTQLSSRSLRGAMRSTGVQASARCVSVGTATASWRKPFTPSLIQTKRCGARLATLPRLDLQEEEEEEREEEHSKTTGSSTSHTSETDSAPPRHQATCVVSASELRALFQTCPMCSRDCEVLQQKLGDCTAFRQKCSNCQYAKRWQSRPGGEGLPAGETETPAEPSAGM